jgi:tetratricopeptide (TPR) repeat protein
MLKQVRLLSLFALACAATFCALPVTAQDAAQEQMFSDQMARGVAAMESSVYPVALAAFREALRIAPGHPEARTMLGTALLENGNAAAAINQLLPVARQFPDLYAARMNLARAYLAADREGAALPELEATVRLQPDDHGSRARLATILMRLRRLDEAAGHARVLAERLPTNVAVQTLLGTVELERGEYSAALAAFEKVSTLRPDEVGGDYGRAAALRGLGRDREAIALLGKIVETSPGHADAWILFGDILSGGSDIESKIAAVDVYRTALKLRPDDIHLVSSLATLYGGAGLDNEMIELLEGSAAAAADLDLSLARAQALFRTERLDEAREAFLAATRFDSAEAWYRLGVTEVNLADLAAAEAAYREALVLAPEHPTARRELQICCSRCWRCFPRTPPLTTSPALPRCVEVTPRRRWCASGERSSSPRRTSMLSTIWAWLCATAATPTPGATHSPEPKRPGTPPRIPPKTRRRERQPRDGLGTSATGSVASTTRCRY